MVMGCEKTNPNKANLLAFSVMRSPMESLRTADSVKMRKRNLKKQSQFAPARIGANSFIKGNYGNKPACGGEENKAKKTNLADHKGIPK